MTLESEAAVRDLTLSTDCVEKLGRSFRGYVRRVIVPANAVQAIGHRSP
jgi:stringent starvation protein B